MKERNPIIKQLYNWKEKKIGSNLCSLNSIELNLRIILCTLNNEVPSPSRGVLDLRLTVPFARHANTSHIDACVYTYGF